MPELKTYEITNRKRRIYDPQGDISHLLITHEGGKDPVVISIASQRRGNRSYHPLAERRATVPPGGAAPVAVGRLHESKRLVAETHGYRGNARITVREISAEEYQDWYQISAPEIERAAKLRREMAAIAGARTRRQQAAEESARCHALAMRSRPRGGRYGADRATEGNPGRRRRYLYQGYQDDAEHYREQVSQADREIGEREGHLRRLLVPDAEAEAQRVLAEIEARYPRRLHGEEL